MPKNALLLSKLAFVLDDYFISFMMMARAVSQVPIIQISRAEQLISCRFYSAYPSSLESL
jgi:hypothetical protein